MIIMGARKKQVKPHHNMSNYVFDEHLSMVEALINTKKYDSGSEVIRTAIEKLFYEECPDPVRQLELEQRRLEDVIHRLNELKNKQTLSMESVLHKYIARKNNFSIPNLKNYEKMTKTWIEKHLPEMAGMFPGKTIDEIYNEMECRCNAKENRK